MEEAYICGIDAEWDPLKAPPKATIVQLAVRTKAGTEAIILLVFMLLPLKSFILPFSCRLVINDDQ